MSKGFKKLIGFIFIILIWSLLTYRKVYSEYLLPSPINVFNEFLSMVDDGSLLSNVLISLKRVFEGYIIAFIMAFGFGIVSIYASNVMEYFNGFIQFLRNVPPLSLIPLIILWVGIGETSKVVIIVLASFFPMFLSIEKGFKSVDEKLVEVGHAFNYSKRDIFFKIVLPSSFPDILVGMRTGLGYAYRAIIGAEMIAASSGLGYMINFARSMSDTSVVLVGIITIGILGYFCDLVFKFLIENLLKDIKGNGWN